MKISQKYLSEGLSQQLKSLPETGMGYQIFSVVLIDGRIFEKVLILNGNEIVNLNGQMVIPFQLHQIKKIIIITDDKFLN